MQLALAAEVVEGQTRSYHFVAQIVGGPDNNRDLYCVSSTWSFGDGPGLTVTPSCAPWTPEVVIRRRFETSHEYAAQGSYDASFAYGPLMAHRVVDVP